MNTGNDIPNMPVTRQRLVVSGRVQGVGFRPAVVRIAHDLGLVGLVRNLQHAVEIQVEGLLERLLEFVCRLRQLPPPIEIMSLVSSSDRPIYDKSFRIEISENTFDRISYIPVDLAPCASCMAELFRASDRRFRYPFISCAACGPRYTTIERLPYDRRYTTMVDFSMCEICLAEYSSPIDRRFHAQSISCPACGPEIYWLDQKGSRIFDGETAIEAALDNLRMGRIVGIKGVGGYQLLTSARDENAVARLRLLKNRPLKPLAIMVPAVSMVSKLCILSNESREYLMSLERPIVLLPKNDAKDSLRLGTVLAPASRYLGVMLPSSPIHALIAEGFAGPLIVTSANPPGEPIAADDAEVLSKLVGMADGWLSHNRRIANRCDDSVMLVSGSCPRVQRLGRGFAPLTLTHELPTRGQVLAIGAQEKNAVAIANQQTIILGPHIGNIGNVATYDFMCASATTLARLVGVSPTIAARDEHPGYDSTRFANTYPRSILVQHHLAHAWSSIAEHNLMGPLLAVVWDGTGYGKDETIWGGEFLRIEGADWRRVARLRPFPLPGGELAVREPRRSALGILEALFGADSVEVAVALNEWFHPSERSMVRSALQRRLNAPLCSSVGRLFDAVAAISGVCQVASYQDHAPSLLEMMGAQARAPRTYAFELLRPRESKDEMIEIDWSAPVEAIIKDVRSGIPATDIAAGFHEALADAAADVIDAADLPTVVLAGGVFNNELLAGRLTEKLIDKGCAVFRPERIPTGDGGLAVGQAAYALVTGWGGNS